MDSIRLTHMVRKAYSAVATKPEKKHAFPVGEKFARKIGYSAEILKQIPAGSKASFAGVSNVSILANLESGNSVLDLGCGAGLDALISSLRVGSSGKVIGLDFSREMLQLARTSALAMGCNNLETCCSGADRLPLKDASIQVALVNGIFNLNPARTQIFQELGRVVVPGGAVFASELILRRSLSKPVEQSMDNWFA